MKNPLVYTLLGLCLVSNAYGLSKDPTVCLTLDSSTYDGTDSARASFGTEEDKEKFLEGLSMKFSFSQKFKVGQTYFSGAHLGEGVFLTASHSAERLIQSQFNLNASESDLQNFMKGETVAVEFQMRSGYVGHFVLGVRENREGLYKQIVRVLVRRPSLRHVKNVLSGYSSVQAEQALPDIALFKVVDQRDLWSGLAAAKVKESGFDKIGKTPMVAVLRKGSMDLSEKGLVFGIVQNDWQDEFGVAFSETLGKCTDRANQFSGAPASYFPKALFRKMYARPADSGGPIITQGHPDAPAEISGVVTGGATITITKDRELDFTEDIAKGHDIKIQFDENSKKYFVKGDALKFEPVQPHANWIQATRNEWQSDKAVWDRLNQNK